MIADKIISIAQTYLGEQEILGNKGFKDPQFQKFMESNGWYMGAPWCMFLSKGIFATAYQQSKYCHYVKTAFTGNALATYYQVAHDGIFKVSSTPIPGAIVIFKEGTDPAKHEGHAGIITEIGDASYGRYFQSIEGNTSGTDPNIREGYIVAEKKHTLVLPPDPHGLNIIGFIIPNEP